MTKKKASWQKHQKDEEGYHDPESCYACLSKREVKSECRCGECCKRLIIETSIEDAEREPKIAEKGSPIYADPRLTRSGERELEGYLLNGENGCVFLNPETNLCGIYRTRPLACRLFDCDGEGREQLVELGILTEKRGGRGV